MHGDCPEQRFVFAQCHHDRRANPGRVDKLSIGLVCTVDLFLGKVGQADDALAAGEPRQRSSGQVCAAFPRHRCDEARVST